MEKIDLIGKKFSNGQTISLIDHSKYVADKSLELFDNIVTEKGSSINFIRELLYLSALFHDIGKCSKSFQDHIRNSNTEETFPHNFYGYVYFNNLIQLTNSNGYKKIIGKVILYHHPYIKDKKQTLDLDKVTDEEYFGTIKEFVASAKDVYSKKFSSEKDKSEENKSEQNENIKFIFRDLSFDDFKELLICDVSMPSYYETKNEGHQISIDEINTWFTIFINIIRFCDSQNLDNVNLSNLYNRESKLTVSIKNSTLNEKKFSIQKEYGENMQLSEKNNMHFTAPTGFGKTITGLIYALKSNKKTFWVCPDNSITQSVYYNICKTLSEKINVHDENGNPVDVKVTLLYENTIKDGCENLDESDIIVTNIDNFLRPIIKNGNLSRCYKMLSYNCIFDEYHAYVTSSALMESFNIMIRVRMKLNSKTLYMSATPVDNFFKKYDKKDKGYPYDKEDAKKHANEDLDKEYVIHFCQTFNDFIEKWKEMKSNGIDISNIAVISNTVNCAQHITSNHGDYFPKIYHARYYDIDKEKIRETINNEYCQNSNVKDKHNWSCTNIISTGIDISFDHIAVISPTQDSFIQSCGRCNRWNTSEANVNNIFVIKEYASKDEVNKLKKDNDPNASSLSNINRSEESFLKNLFRQELVEKFYAFMQNNMNDGSTIKLKDLYDLREKFLKENSKTYTTNHYNKCLMESIRNMENITYTFGYGEQINEETNEEKNKPEFIANNKLRDVGGTNFYCVLPNRNGKYPDDDDHLFVGNDIIFSVFMNDDNYRKGFNLKRTNERWNSANKKNKPKRVSKKIKIGAKEDLGFSKLMEKSKNKNYPILIDKDYAIYDDELGILKQYKTS